MTIFQKMILIPVLSLVLYGSFITYSFFEHKQSNQKIKKLRDNYVPVMNMLSHNVLLFERIRDTFKDTVLAQEPLWLADVFSLKSELNSNLQQLSDYPLIVNPNELQASKDDFERYFIHANKLAKSLLQEQDITHFDPASIQEVEHYLLQSQENFQQLKSTVQSQLISSIDHTTEVMNQLLFWGSIIAIASVFVLIIATYFLSVSTRNSFISIVQRAKLLSQGDTDFSKRLSRTQRDELGVLIHWFNKLSDKLEADYLKLQTLSITDKLTQLNNRTRTDQFLPEAISHALESQKSLVMVILDIDHFKRVNDDFGHLAGDEVLKMFAALLKESGKSGDYISRWGGEEFVLVWQNIEFTDAVEKANTIRQLIEKSDFPTVGKVTASLGLTFLNKVDSIESLIERADNHLYQAKENGRNRVVVDA